MNNSKISSSNAVGGNTLSPVLKALLNQPEQLAYNSLSELERARFARQLRQKFDVSRKRARLNRKKALRKIRPPLKLWTPAEPS